MSRPIVQGFVETGYGVYVDQLLDALLDGLFTVWSDGSLQRVTEKPFDQMASFGADILGSEPSTEFGF